MVQVNCTLPFSQELYYPLAFILLLVVLISNEPQHRGVIYTCSSTGFYGLV